MTEQDLRDRLKLFLPSSAAARELGVSANTVARLADDGRIEYVDTVLGRLYDPESVERLRLARLGGSVH